MTNIYSLIDDLTHIAEMKAVVKNLLISHNDSNYNHSELEVEIDTFITDINLTVNTFLRALHTYETKVTNQIFELEEPINT